MRLPDSPSLYLCVTATAASPPPPPDRRGGVPAAVDVLDPLVEGQALVLPRPRGSTILVHSRIGQAGLTKPRARCSPLHRRPPPRVGRRGSTQVDLLRDRGGRMEQRPGARLTERPSGNDVSHPRASSTAHHVSDRPLCYGALALERPYRRRVLAAGRWRPGGVRRTLRSPRRRGTRSRSPAGCGEREDSAGRSPCRGTRRPWPDAAAVWKWCALHPAEKSGGLLRRSVGRVTAVRLRVAGPAALLLATGRTPMQTVLDFKRLEGCGPVDDADVRGHWPPYGARPSSTPSANDLAMCARALGAGRPRVAGAAGYDDRGRDDVRRGL